MIFKSVIPKIDALIVKLADTYKTQVDPRFLGGEALSRKLDAEMDQEEIVRIEIEKEIEQ